MHMVPLVRLISYQVPVVLVLVVSIVLVPVVICAYEHVELYGVVLTRVMVMHVCKHISYGSSPNFVYVPSGTVLTFQVWLRY